MSTLYIRQIKKSLEDKFEGLIDLSDIRTTKKAEITPQFLTRALAAFAIHTAGNVSPEVAATAIVDGFGDLGMDAVHYDQNHATLWIVQSKWIANGTGEPANGDVLKFKEGIDRLHQLDLEGANERLQAKQNEILAALMNHHVRHRYVLVYTGDKLTRKNKGALDRYVKRLNNGHDQFEMMVLGLDEVYQLLLASAKGSEFNDQIGLKDWGVCNEPFATFYGRVTGDVVAGWWAERRQSLFSENIRSFLGATEINNAIETTAIKQPQNIWYFNNGITILCDRIHKTAMFGDDRTAGVFHCQGMRIVNGMQTVGAIGRAFENNPEQVKQAELFIRLISLENCPPQFSAQITKATNTQNEVRAEDFVSLNEHQKRIWAELKSSKIEYHIQHSELETSDVQNCTLEEAAIALACAHRNIELAFKARYAVHEFWRDTQTKPYTDIFNSRTIGEYVWRAIRVARALQSVCASNTPSVELKLKDAQLWMLHCLFLDMEKKTLTDGGFNFDEFETQQLPTRAQSSVDIGLAVLDQHFKRGYTSTRFENLDTWRQLATAHQEKSRQRDAPKGKSTNNRSRRKE